MREQRKATFGEVLRSFRISTGLSQEQLAGRAGVSLAAVSALERGTRRAPQRATLALLAGALQLTGDDLQTFERSAGRVRHREIARTRTIPATVPVYVTSFIGREEEIARVTAWLAQDRIVSLVGPGGIGKTRLACEIAIRAAKTFERVVFADLTPMRDDAVVFSALATLLGGTSEAAADPLASLLATISDSRTLLVLDNCEHLLQTAATTVAALLRARETITVIATSRERLAISGERVFRLRPLSLEDTETGSAAVRLFVARAEAADPDVDPRGEDVLEICRRLDGMPLAIELAAAHLPAVGLRGIREQIERELRLATPLRDVPKRHATMDAVMQWSYALLSSDEAAVLARAAVFLGGFTLAAAEHVCAGEGIAAPRMLEILSKLVERSLLVLSSTHDEPRYTMLLFVQTFALERLRERGEEEQLIRRHASWVAEIVQFSAEGSFATSDRSKTERLEREIDNVRVALRRLLAFERHDDTLRAAEIAGTARLLWISGRHDEGRRLAQELLGKLTLPRDDRTAAPLLRLLVQTSIHEREDNAELAFAVFERIGDDDGIASLLLHSLLQCANTRNIANAEAIVARADAFFCASSELGEAFYGMYMTVRSYLRAVQGRFDEALSDDARAVESGCGDEWLRLEIRSVIDAGLGKYAEARDRLEKSVRIRGRKQNPEGDVEFVHLAEATGDHDRSRSLLKTWLDQPDQRVATSLTELLAPFPAIAVRLGDFHAAAMLRGTFDRLREQRRAYRTILGEQLDTAAYETLAQKLSEPEIARLAEVGAAMPIPNVIALMRRIIASMAGTRAESDRQPHADATRETRGSPRG